MTVAYAKGDTSVPLLDETIGGNLERTVARCGDRDALVSVHQGIRQSYREFDQRVDRVLTEVDQEVAKYIRGQLFVGFVLFCCFAVATIRC